MDKRERSEIFMQRLVQSMDQEKMTRSELARVAGVDRSTIGQLLNKDIARLPNGQLVADLASALGVSADWLLGLTHRPERPGDMIAAAMTLSPAERSTADSQLLDWHREAAGYKIRHVPATLPDILKTEGFVSWEYASLEEGSLKLALEATERQLAWLKAGESDYEIAIPVHELKSCALGTGYYAGLAKSVRDEQLRAIADICRDLFPRLRLYLFDARTQFSAPVTVFGPQLAIIYVGKIYLAFRESERISSMTDHFDWLVREAIVDSRHVPDFIEGLLS